VLRFNRIVVRNECAPAVTVLRPLHISPRQHRPYPKEGAWHRLRHFTLAALRSPDDAMNLNYNPGCPRLFLRLRTSI
jgi:hypothetical protein